MQLIMPFVVGILFAAGIYMILRRSIVKLVIGLMFLGHAANLLIFTAGRLTPGGAPLVPPGRDTVSGPTADPLPQAVILTAIVIGLGVQAFALVLVKRAYQTVGTDDLDAMRSTDT